jgi:hypothetical protein
LKGTKDFYLSLGGGYASSLGSGVTSWNAKKQKTVAASSCEAKYTAGSKEGIWLRALLTGIGTPPSDPTTIFCDNNTAINLSEDPLLHAWVKHIDIKFHFLRERVQSRELLFSYINTKDNIADIFTKGLEYHQFARLRGFLGLKSLTEASMRGGASTVRRSVESCTMYADDR